VQPPSTSTYRLQLRQGVGLREARALVPHLHRLGVGALYLSPPWTAVKGSTHGYDVTDPATVDPQVGSMQEFLDLSAALRRRGMGLVVDVVPNHMAATPENPWWRDVLRKGKRSAYARWFDVDWTQQPIPLPVLQEPLRTLRRQGRVALRVAADGLWADVDGQAWPLSCASAAAWLRTASDQAGRWQTEFLAAARSATEAQLVDRMWRLATGEAGPVLAARLSSADPLRVLARQAYRLVPWRDGLRRLAYRRFFDVDGLVGLRMEDAGACAAVHALPIAWARAGIVTGLRVDHIDGLRDPAAYLASLSASAPVPVWVEKILGGGERLPGWPVAGTTGYDAAAALAGLFVPPDGLARLTDAFRDGTGQPSWESTLQASKGDVLATTFQPEMAALAHGLCRLAPGLSQAAARKAIVAVTLALRQYRTYAAAGSALAAADREAIAAAIAEARGRVPRRAVDAVEAVLLRPQSREAHAWRAAWQQRSGAVAAKGVEDCALYRWTPLAALGDVGSDPSRATSVQAWHVDNAQRLARSPWSMTAGTTHDSKRSEDVRLRLAGLAEDAEAWLGLQESWRHAVDARLDGLPALEGLVFQTVVGLWPLVGPADAALTQRLAAYAVKAAREARHGTSWLEPDDGLEDRIRAFVAAAVQGPKPPGWHPFVRDVQRAGFANSLSAATLRLLAPGVPDLYQGDESWNGLLVDPDNRHPVPPGALAKALDAAWAAPWPDLLAAWRDGRLKTRIVSSLLRLRRLRPALFIDGEYVPIPAEGPRAGHVVAFARRRGAGWCVAAAARWTLRLPARADGRIHPRAWTATTIQLPDGAPRAWRDALSGRFVDAADGTLDLSMLWADVPCAALESGPPEGGPLIP